MFKSIRWRIVIIYFLLIYLAMTIVGFFIITQFEKIQLDMNSDSIKQRITQIYASSTAMKQNDWEIEEIIEKIQSNINYSIQIGYNENLYIILNDDKKTIIAASKNEVENISAYDVDRISNKILVEALSGVTTETITKDDEDNRVESHITYPVRNEMNQIKGYIYLTSDISYIYDTVNESKTMLTKATLMVLLLTVILGLILSRTITGPIKELTINAKKMSQGDFAHKVKIKSDDEIGQLGEVFNYLTDQLTSIMSKLNQEKSKMETTFTYMADGVLTVDKNGNIIHINPIAKKILSVRAKDTIYDEIMSKHAQDLYLDNIKETNWSGTYVLKTKNETYKIDYAPFKDGNDELGGVILVFKNVTEQVKMDKLQKEFVANVSHELKTPITTIKSYTETLLEGAIKEENVATDFLNVINSESDRMTRLVRDLLKLSKMDFEEDNFKKEKLNINRIVKEVYMKLILQAKGKKIDMPLRLEDIDCNVLFDKDGLEQILLNIIGNAIKYTPERGKVIVSVSLEKSKVVVKIEDNGIGIPKEDAGRVFERFYRVDKARTRKLGGTGLGLSIAQQIAKAHDSIIEVKSEFNKGTTVQVKIPKYLK
ncbi:HAMP domain-containing protein [Sedimentibacter sp. zth1]|uniref:sensor histidine kinase n=1 Tax=Sedimentibacter sp. zth1 TaxID=2816908 RepID=UPI001A91099E|nr:ATP-binding protein [Sedimentibacter sp. zth1]QSX05025.1 HAMP domain-containing protein [Sedimentibacter sp. zth1]